MVPKRFSQSSATRSGIAKLQLKPLPSPNRRGKDERLDQRNYDKTLINIKTSSYTTAYPYLIFKEDSFYLDKQVYT